MCCLGEANNGGEWIGTVIALVAAEMWPTGGTPHVECSLPDGACAVAASRRERSRLAPRMRMIAVITLASSLAWKRVSKLGGCPDAQSQQDGRGSLGADGAAPESTAQGAEPGGPAMTWEREQIGACTLYRGDAREVLATLSPVDHVVTDPTWMLTETPFAIKGASVAPERYQATTLSGDPLGQWDVKIIEHCQALCEGNMFFFAGWKELGLLITSLRHYQGTFAWHKPNGYPTFSYTAKMDLAFIVWAAKTSALYGYQHWPSTGFRAAVPLGGCFASERITNLTTGKNLHPAQGPLALYEQLLQPLPPGHCLDPFMGTGTTGVACVRQGRSFTGIELESRYFDLACTRIDEATRQGDLFVAPRCAPVVSRRSCYDLGAGTDWDLYAVPGRSPRGAPDVGAGGCRRNGSAVWCRVGNENQ